MGDATFDSFYASTVPSLVSDEETSEKIQSAGPALLDKTGVSCRANAIRRLLMEYKACDFADSLAIGTFGLGSGRLQTEPC